MQNGAESKLNIGKRGLPLRGILYSLLFIGLALSVLLIIETFITNAGYSSMREENDRFIECENCVNELQAASDYLTAEVRSFAMTDGDVKHVDNYFYELHTLRRREKAVARLREICDDEDVIANLDDALKYSDELYETEIYIMRLMFEARGSGLNRYPEVEEVELLEKHTKITAARMIEDAKNMCFDKQYQMQKDKISASTNLCMSALLAETRANDAQNSAELIRLMRTQRTLIFLLIGVILLAGILTTTLIISPVNKGAASVNRQEFIPVKGSREMRTLAQRYNKMFEDNRIKHEQLSYEATHDALTGLCNRAVFENECASETSFGKAVLTLDVDRFKVINDTYGHDVGDAVLKKVAALLKSNFRANDRICRIGGDEFVVIMDDVAPDAAEFLSGKFSEISGKLAAAEEGIPSTSVSAGLAFGKEGVSGETLYKNADKALYEVKNSKRGEFRVFAE